MKSEYTSIRRIYAWVGFLAIPLALILAAYIAYGGLHDECIGSEESTPYNPISDVLESPIQAILATSTEPVLDFVEKSQIVDTFKAQITGYNTVPEQTDSTPCIAADGSNICGRYDTLACPTAYALGTKFFIYGRIYECVDRTNPVHDGKFDINCNKDFDCPRAVTSYADVQVLD